MMSTSLVMLLLLVLFGATLSAVLSAYREDDRRAILRGTVRRTMLFCSAVLGIALLAYLVSTQILLPSA